MKNWCFKVISVVVVGDVAVFCGATVKPEIRLPGPLAAQQKPLTCGAQRALVVGRTDWQVPPCTDSHTTRTATVFEDCPCFLADQN